MRSIPPGALLGIFVLAFAGNMLLYRLAGRDGVRMLDMTSGAFLIAGLAMAPFLGRLAPAPGRRARLRLVVSLAIIILIGGVVAFWAMAEGLRISGAARGGLIFMTVPVVTAMIEALLGTRFARRILATGGLIVLGGLLLSAPGLAGASNPRGDLLLAITAVTFAIANVAARTATAAWPPVSVAAFRAGGAGLGLLLVGAAPFAAGRWAVASGLLAAVFLSTFYVLIERIGPARASLANVYSSLLAALFGVLFMGESLAPIQIAGGLVIIVASLAEIRARVVEDDSARAA